jgi:glycosyltransferase involved in cell wall biosynthesis
MSGSSSPRAALVTTVINEASTLPVLLASIEQQTRLPDEVIVVDGGSTDESLAILEDWSSRLPLEIVSRPGANISEGRNLAIARTNCDLVAVTDAGVVLESDWLERLIGPLTQDALPVDVSAGFFKPDCHGDFEIALAASTLPDEQEIIPETFLPSSRSIAFRRSWFDAGVQYPEWLDYCEDLVFDLRLKRAGARFLFRPDAVVWFRPRSNIGSFFRQYYRYARGDGKAGLFFKRNFVRYVTYLVVLPSLLLTRSLIWRVLVLTGAVLYMRRPAERLWRRSNSDLTTTVKLLPVATFLRATGDLAKMLGYPAGLLWRARRYGLKRDWRTIPEQRE